MHQLNNDSNSMAKLVLKERIAELEHFIQFFNELNPFREMTCCIIAQDDISKHEKMINELTSFAGVISHMIESQYLEKTKESLFNFKDRLNGSSLSFVDTIKNIVDDTNYILYLAKNKVSEAEKTIADLESDKLKYK